MMKSFFREEKYQRNYKQQFHTRYRVEDLSNLIDDETFFLGRKSTKGTTNNSFTHGIGQGI